MSTKIECRRYGADPYWGVTFKGMFFPFPTKKDAEDAEPDIPKMYQNLVGSLLCESPVVKTPTKQLFLDCDGVLADFDTYAEQIFGLPPRKAEDQIGIKRFWADLQSHPDFYRKLPLMVGALKLFDAVKHYNPVILTGCPLGGWAEEQKLDWAAKHFPGTKMITCMSKDKRNHMKPGDVLVDDWPKYKPLWEEAGGVFILYENPEQAIPAIIEAMETP